MVTKESKWSFFQKYNSSPKHQDNISEHMSSISGIRKSFHSLNIYLWFHCIGFRNGCKFSKRFIYKSVASLILAIIHEGFLLLQIFQVLLNLSLESKGIKTSINLIAVYLMDICARILFYFNRKKLEAISKQLDYIYTSISAGKSLHFQPYISAGLIATDLCASIQVLLYLCIIIPSFSANSSERNNYILSAMRYSDIFNHISTVIFLFNSIKNVLIVYFCCICFILKHILLELKTQFRRKSNANKEFYYTIYEKTIKIIYKINIIFHDMLLIVFILLLILIFYESYVLIFIQNHSKMICAYRLTILTIAIIQYWFACVYGSSITKADLKVREEISKIVCDVTNNKNLSYKVKLQERFVGFSLLETFVINKSLFLASAGSLMTYGILIATFNVNASGESK